MQSAMILYAPGNRVEIGIGRATTDLAGTELLGPSPMATGDVSGDFTLPSIALKMDLTDRLSAALIYDQPFGAGILYSYGTPAGSLLSGTSARADVEALTALLKYDLTGRVSAFGGLRLQRASGAITLSGTGYGAAPPAGLNGYSVELGTDTSAGYVLGAAYEIPEIALRAALTYNSAIEHELPTTESIAPGVGTTTTSRTPRSWTLEFQTGIAPDTLLSASVRYVKHSEFKIRPTLVDTDLVGLRDTTTYRLGIGHRFTPRLSASVTLAYEPANSRLVSPLAPSTGLSSVTLGASYKLTDTLELSGGVSQTWLGEAQANTVGPGLVGFDDSTVQAVGMKLTYLF